MQRKIASVLVEAYRGNLADCTSKDPKALSEIFLVEGEFCGGTAKQGRETVCFSYLPLRGKILNVEKSNAHKFLESEEIKK